MPRTKLTQLVVDHLAKAPAPPADTTTWDTVLPGFGLRRRPSGGASWVTMFRVCGKLERSTIGPLAKFPKVDEARSEARQLMADAARGASPAAAKRERRRAAAEPASKPKTLTETAELYVERYCKPATRSWRDTAGRLRNHVLPKLGKRPISELRRGEIIALLDDMVAAGQPVSANRVRAALSGLFAWAVEKDLVAASPMQRVKAPAPETARDVVLADSELVTLWRRADAIGGPGAAFVKLLLLSGQRRNEVSTMKWDDLDLDAAVWTLPRETTKADRSHEVPLAPAAVEILKAQPRKTRTMPDQTTQPSPWVFTTNGEAPISGFSKLKARFDQPEPLRDDWRFHDLRRTCGTGLARLSVPVSTISRVLNHTEGGVTKIYNRYSYLDEKRHALNLWAAHIDRLLKPQPKNVEELDAHRATREAAA